MGKREGKAKEKWETVRERWRSTGRIGKFEFVGSVVAAINSWINYHVFYVCITIQAPITMQ